DPAGVRLDVAGEDLDQRRLAGAVVADQAEHLALVEVQRDVDERRHGAEALRDVLDAQSLRATVAAHCNLPRFRRRATWTFAIIEARIASPMIRSKSKALTPMMFRPVRRMMITPTPMNPPTTVPTPPKSEVPPMTAPATARNIRSGPPWSGTIVVTRVESTIPAKPASTFASTKLPILIQ